MLDADFTGSQIGVARREHLSVEHCIPDGVAMNFGAMVVSEFGGFRG